MTLRSGSWILTERRSVSLGGMAAALIAVMSSPAAAQSAVDADLQRYCRETFTNSAYELRAQTWEVEHYCNQGGTLQNIDFAEACRMTTGSGEFRKDGRRILCAASAARPAPAADAGPPDFQRYCRETFPNSTHESRAESWGVVVHYCRRPGATGGFTLQQIDLADACRATHGTPDYREEGNRVVCGSATVQGTYTWPQSGFVYKGPLKSGKPHGIGWTRIPPTGADWVGEHRDGKVVGAHLARKRGSLTCWNLGGYKPGQIMQKLPMSSCASLQQYMKSIP